MGISLGSSAAESMMMIVVVLVTVAVRGARSSTVFEVGNVAGWNLPSVAHVNYTSWADSHTFVVGDILHFRYNRSNHNVVLVSKVDYESCDARNPITIYDDGDTSLNLNRSGTFYIVCSVPTHCESGEKVTIHVRKHPLPSSKSISPTSSITTSSPPNAMPTNLPPPNTSHGPLLQPTNCMLLASLLVSIFSFMQF